MTKKPKWAKPLNSKQWKHLQECQQTSRPSLRQLKADREHQVANDVRCVNCEWCANTLSLAKG